MYNSAWYYSLTRPPFCPPDFVFTPVWAILYAFIFLSLIFYIAKPSYNKKSGYIYFCVQLLINLIWPSIFFGMNNISLALLIVVLLDVFVFLTVKRFYAVTKVGGILLIPYFLWCIFATYLNFGYFLLN